MSSLLLATALPTSLPLPGGLRPGAIDILSKLRRAARSDRRAESRQRNRILRAASRHQPIVLGTAARPWEPARRSSPESSSPLESLKSFGGLEIQITAQSPRALQELEVLIELDRDHAVHVDVVVDDVSLRSRKTQGALQMARRLVGEGLSTRVLVLADGLRDGQDRLRRFFEAVRDAGASDVRTESRGAEDRRASRFARLRLQHGFPLAQPGRG